MTRNRSGLARMSLAITVACALVPAGLAAASSNAAAGHKKKVCRLVVPTPQNTLASPGIGAAGSATPSQLDPALQVISADVATKGQTLTWVIRVKKLTSSYSSQAPLGRGYQFKFTANGVDINLLATQSQLGTQATATLPHSKATFDTQHNEVRESVPFGDIANQFGVSIRNGQTRFTNLTAFTSYSTYVPGAEANPYYMMNGTAEQIGPVASTYLAGTPSCVKVGS